MTDFSFPDSPIHILEQTGASRIVPPNIRALFPQSVKAE
jgi:hypothetical protein